MDLDKQLLIPVDTNIAYRLHVESLESCYTLSAGKWIAAYAGLIFRSEVEIKLVATS